MKRCNGCSERCELGYTVTDRTQQIAPRVGDVTYWIYDVYASGVQRTLFTSFVGTKADKAKLISLAIKRAKDIARYCREHRCQR